MIISTVFNFFFLQTVVNLEVSDKGTVDIGDTLVIEGFRFVSAASVKELRQLDHKYV